MSYKRREEHEGERAFHRRMGYPEAMSHRMSDILQEGVPEWSVDLASNAPFVVIAAVDPRTGIPWPTLVCATNAKQPSVVTVNDERDVVVDGVLHAFDPLMSAVFSSRQPTTLFAGQYIDFAAQRRNKFSGIMSASRQSQKGNSAAATGWVPVHMELTADEGLGNCPKYITRRDVRALQLDEGKREAPRLVSKGGADATAECGRFPAAAARAVLDASSTAWLATKHTKDRDEAARDVGLNHRGGPAGWIRLLEREDGAVFVVLPDYSGNTLFQSLGNLELDPVAGVLVVDFITMNALYVGGEAVTLIGEEARRIAPRFDRLTMVRVDEWALVEKAFPLTLRGPEVFSIYNPQVRYLANEIAGGTPSSDQDDDNSASKSFATITSVRRFDDVAEVQVDLYPPIAIEPGDAVVMDCSSLIPKRAYRHMNDANPQSLNDDLVRTWTAVLPSTWTPSGPSTSLSLILKLKPRGAITPALFRLADSSRAGPVRLPFLGVSHGMRLPASLLARGLGDSSEVQRMLWIAGGVGVTPFITFARTLVQHARAATTVPLAFDVVVLVTSKDVSDHAVDTLFAALNTLEDLDIGAVSRAQFVTKRAQGVSPASAAPANMLHRHQHHFRRLEAGDIASVSHVASRSAFICGPPALTQTITEWLRSAGVPSKQIAFESFAF